MQPETQPLIVGAGPVGLAAALMLARDGVTPRVIDAQPERSPHSKALAVNPRTLDILTSTGVTQRMLKLGLRIKGAMLWRDGRLLARISFSRLRHPYPFMLALSQAQSERLLEEAALELGVHVERGVELTACRSMEEGAEAELVHRSGGRRETITAPWLLGADGAHSTVRHQLGIEFHGRSFEREWQLADARLQTDLVDNHAHIVFLKEGGFVFLFRVIGGEAANDGAPLWRVLTNSEAPIRELDVVRMTEEPVWESRFKIAHKVADRLSLGQVFLAGDAAHVHSPMGARGMNLGIEDAYVFARLHKEGQLSQYGATRRRIDRRVVKRIEVATRMARGESAISQFARRWVAPLAARAPVVRRAVLRTVTGLDHPL